MRQMELVDVAPDRGTVVMTSDGRPGVVAGRGADGAVRVTLAPGQYRPAVVEDVAALAVEVRSWLRARSGVFPADGVPEPAPGERVEHVAAADLQVMRRCDGVTVLCWDGGRLEVADGTVLVVPD